MINYLLWLKLSTNSDLALSRPSGTWRRVLWLRSRVVSSSIWKISWGKLELLKLLYLKLIERRQGREVTSPYTRSTLFLFKLRCSWKIIQIRYTVFENGKCYDQGNNLTSFWSLPNSSGASVRPVSSSFSHRRPTISLIPSGNCPSCIRSHPKQIKQMLQSSDFSNDSMHWFGRIFFLI